ncbi:hypothetical protein GFY24_23405 [Nocardia sp. SYP-A9097]|uniref:hypothetical protein n=1 Tax=Nocardia sp. SYP-A9097 TaxID=2663237 RepID=UPI00129BC188|nr:hypothetical protein [Nocardia sp. SYP-A9097]MRH90351.1 hypothetical protein [Nocardia sp. SYP-A9097]
MKQVRDSLAEELPWLMWLPTDARTQCAEELHSQMLAGTEAIPSLTVSQLLREWQATAEIYSDPELAQRLRGPFDTTDAVEVERPSTVVG